jgi:hypothetical protein
MKRFFSVILVAALAVILFECEKNGPTGPQGPAGAPGESASWKEPVEAYEGKLFSIGIIPEGEDYIELIGTGFSLGPNQILTNAHVVYVLYDLAHSEDFSSPANRIVAVRDKTFTGEDGTFDLIDASIHPGYDNLNVFSNDFAVFTASHGNTTVDIASSEDLASLYVGQPVGTLGFPAELSFPDMDGRQPIATFKDGIISSVPLIQPRLQPAAGKMLCSSIILILPEARVAAQCSIPTVKQLALITPGLPSLSRTFTDATL